MEFIGDIIGVTKFTLVNWFKQFRINRQDKEIIKKVREKTNLIKFGYIQYSSSDECKEKVKQTNLERYGVEYIFTTNEFKERVKQTCLEKYGVEYPQQLEEIKQKQIESDKRNHGGVIHQKTDEFMKKIRQTNLERYGVEIITQSEKIKEKYKQTCLEKYGVENSAQRNYDLISYEIIKDEDKLLKYIEENNIINIKDLSKKLNINPCSLGNFIRKYNLKCNFDYSMSLKEKEIREYVNQYYETENNTRKYLDGKEIDIFIPKLNMGIEFNGDYWHCEKYKDKKYHQEKSLYATNENIFIYHIFEYEWKEKKQQIINQLNKLLIINVDKIYARKCVIKEVDNKEKIEFLELNHLQGNDQSSIKLGLYYNDELVSLMTFVKPRFNKKYQYELSRFCSKTNCNVIGGASKLFKYFIDNYNPQSIISYSNIAHTKGKLYETLGFNFDSITEPNYVWSNGHKVLSRYQCQKHRLIQEGYEGNTESEIMHNMGYSKLYDCGNKVWVWNKNT